MNGEWGALALHEEMEMLSAHTSFLFFETSPCPMKTTQLGFSHGAHLKPDANVSHVVLFIQLCF